MILWLCHLYSFYHEEINLSDIQFSNRKIFSYEAANIKIIKSKIANINRKIWSLERAIVTKMWKSLYSPFSQCFEKFVFPYVNLSLYLL